MTENITKMLDMLAGIRGGQRLQLVLTGISLLLILGIFVLQIYSMRQTRRYFKLVKELNRILGERIDNLERVLGLRIDLRIDPPPGPPDPERQVIQ